MRYTAIALDYDGTIAHDGVVPPHVLDGLRRLKATGRKLDPEPYIAHLTTKYSELYSL